MVGLVVGMIRFIWEFSYSAVPCGEEASDSRPAIIKDVHYLHFGIILFFVTFFTAIAVSLVTKPIDDKYVSFLLLKLFQQGENNVIEIKVYEGLFVCFMGGGG